MKSKRLIGGGLCVVALASLLVVTGCGNGHDHGDGGKAVKVANTVCPVMGKKLPAAGVSADLVREYKGRKIGFCCAGCPKKWDKLPDAKKIELMAKLSGDK